jgi:hypothetical protein
MNITENRQSIKVCYLVLLAYLVFLSVNITYFYYFTTNWEYLLSDGLNQDNFFGYILNGDSYKAYIPDLNSLINGEYLNFRFGHAIAYIFFVIWMIIPYEIDNVIYVAFIVNNLAIIVSYIYFYKIGKKVLGLDMRYRWIFFLNPILVYSSQMISKEAFLFAGISLACYYSFSRKFWIPLLTSSILILVRFPFFLLWPTMRFICEFRKNRINVILLLTLMIFYLVASGYYMSKIPFDVFEEFESSGITRLAFQNNFFYLGNVFFFPAKFVSIFFDLFSNGLFYSFKDGRIILYHAVTVPMVFFLMWHVREIIYITTHPLKILRSKYGGIFAFVLIFLVILSGNIFIHSRYLWPILPLLFLLLCSIKKDLTSCRSCSFG